MENLGVNNTKKPRPHQQNIRFKSLLPSRVPNEGQNRTNTTNPRILSKDESFEGRAKELNERKKNGGDPLFPKKQSLVMGSAQKKLECGEKIPGLQMSKSFSVEPKDNGRERRRYHGSRSVSPMLNSREKQQYLNKAVPQKLKSPVRNNRNNYTENFESLSLLSKAVYEQGQVIEMFCMEREELLRKMAEKMKMNRRSMEATGEFEFQYFPPSGKDSDISGFPNFENAYSGTLEEIFQAWVHLFYFIINLRINFIRLLNYANCEGFRPKGDFEKEIIRQAIECVKFFSLLKIKSMADSVDELDSAGGQYLTPTQIRNYEQQLSSPFLCEMNFIQKKAREILCQAKTVTTT